MESRSRALASRVQRLAGSRSATVVVASALLLACVSAAKRQPTHYENTFAPGDELELRVYLSPQLRFSAFNNECRNLVRRPRDTCVPLRACVCVHMSVHGRVHSARRT